MESRDSLPSGFSQNDSLPIRLVALGFGHVSPEAAAPYGSTHRLSYYFFLFVWEGTTEFGVDLENLAVRPHELAFALPHQIRQLPATPHGTMYYKLGLPEEGLSRLPRHYPFLLNPLNQQKIRFAAPAAVRLRTVFELLMGLLRTPDTHPELITVHGPSAGSLHCRAAIAGGQPSGLATARAPGFVGQYPADEENPALRVLRLPSKSC